MIHYARTGCDLLIIPCPYIKITMGSEEPYIQVVSEADMTKGSIPEISILANSPKIQKPFTVVESRYQPDGPVSLHLSSYAGMRVPVSYGFPPSYTQVIMVTEINEFLDILPVHFVIRATDLVLRTIDNLNFFREQKLLNEVQKLYDNDFPIKERLL